MTRRSVPEPTLVAQLVRRRVVVTEVDGSGWDGVALQSDPSGLVLVGSAGRALERLDGAGVATEVDGAVFVPAARVQFVQVPDGWVVG